MHYEPTATEVAAATTFPLAFYVHTYVRGIYRILDVVKMTRIACNCISVENNGKRNDRAFLVYVVTRFDLFRLNESAISYS